MAHARTLADADITTTNPVTAVEEDWDHKTTGIGMEATAV